VGGFGKEEVRRGSPRGCAFDWVKIAGQSKKLPISTFALGSVEGRLLGEASLGFGGDLGGVLYNLYKIFPNYHRRGDLVSLLFLIH
jgi:hypothetical protein